MMAMKLAIAVGAAFALADAISVQAQEAGSTFSDCESCPEMVVIPQGSAMIGPEPYEANRQEGWGHLREVTIAYDFAIASKEITRGQYREFIAATGYDMVREGCNSWSPARQIGFVREHWWDAPGYYQTDDHPVVCVSVPDAEAFTSWLSAKTGRPYRLLTSTEFEYATRAGARGPWFWGAREKDACQYANVADATFRRNFVYGPVFNCNDGYEYTAPVGSFAPNPWGLYDMLGNAWEWTVDCHHEDMRAIPLDGSAWMAEDGGKCDRRVPRGGSWVSGTDWVRAAAQAGDWANYHSQLLGFRVAMTLE